MSTFWNSPGLPGAGPEVLALVANRVPNGIRAKQAAGQITLLVDRDHLVDVCRQLRDDPDLAFDLLVVETAVDWVDWFDVVYLARSTSLGHTLGFTVQIGRDDPVVPSVSSIWRAAIWMERETNDLMGIQFQNHPDPRRILTWDEFEGHPLRKDFGLGADIGAYDQVPNGYKKVGEQ